MLGWTLTFLIFALIAAALGLTGMTGASAWIAQPLFVIFLFALIASARLHLVQRAAR